MPKISVHKFSLTWAVFLICILWASACTMYHVLKTLPLKQWIDSNKTLQRITPSTRRNVANRRLFNILICAIFTLTWIPCFVFTYHLYFIFIQSGVVSTNWTFGQIISFTIWCPFAVELFHIEYGKPDSLKPDIDSTSVSANDFLSFMDQRVWSERLDTNIPPAYRSSII